jgi:hypothetical protein
MLREGEAGVHDAVAAVASADDVVVEDGVDGPVRGGGSTGMERGADEPLLFACKRDEHERGVELDAALREHPRKLHHQRRAAAIVVRARRVVVGASPVEAVAVARAVGPAGHRVVVAGDVNTARRSPWQDGDDVPELHVTRQPPSLRRDLVGVELDLQARSGCSHLLPDPLARGPDAASG